MEKINDILEMVASYDSDADLDLIRRAYVFSGRAHQGQTRLSGEPYLVHPLGVARILAEMRLDVQSIVAGILHDTVEDTLTTLEEIERCFGREIMELVDGVTKLGKIQFTSSEEKQAENFRKMVMAMAKDVRVILIKLADRLHNMRTLEYMPEEKQDRIAKETLEIYAPIANRLGMQKMKVELEDLALRYLKPEVYKAIDEQIASRRGRLERYIDEVADLVKKEMSSHGINAEVKGRIKHYYSIHRKMETQHLTFDQVHDLIAFRIILEKISECYEALGIIHSMWRPVPGRFKDYIAMPKVNNYQSLHTTVIGPHGERVEFQIRTKEMNEVAENGIAAHWKYKEGGKIKDVDERKFRWIRQLLEWHSELADPTEFLETVKLDLFADSVYVFTPKGDLVELPRGSTPVDFAYAIHTGVGNTCVGARVNGRIVPLKYELRSGDTVEILTQKNKHPNKDWLQFVKTSRAKTKIRMYLKELERERGVSIGKGLLMKECELYHKSFTQLIEEPKLKEFAKIKGYKDVDSLMIAIGYGKISPHAVCEYVYPDLQKKTEQPSGVSRLAEVVKRLVGRKKGIIKVDGYDDFLIHFGKCCNPIPGDPIVGYVTQGRGISVHIATCPRAMEYDAGRKVRVEWGGDAGFLRTAKVRVVCVDKPGMLAAMTDVITRHGVNIARAVAGDKEGELSVNLFELEVDNVNRLKKVMKSLEGIKGVVSVRRE